MASVAMLAAGVLSGCSGSSSGPPTLNWFYTPDAGTSAKVAAECTASAGGAYTIATIPLAGTANQQLASLSTRLSAKDSTIDLISIDPIIVPVLAEPHFLDPAPADLVAGLTADDSKQSIQTSTWNGKLMAAPFTTNVQLLWYQKPVAAKAGLDMTKPVTWDQIITAAQQQHKTVAVQASDYEGYMVWINALIAGAGGSIVENPGAKASHLKLGLTTPAGQDAAAVIRKLVQAGVGGPAISSSTEGPALTLFQSPESGFMVNWPFVWSGSSPAQKATIGFAEYPETVAGHPAAPPIGGADVGVGAYSTHKAAAWKAAQCITNPAHQLQEMVEEGGPAANTTVYTDPAALKAFPDGLAAAMLKSVLQSVPRPQTQYYNDLTTALAKEFSPPQSVNSATPQKAQNFILQVVKGKRLL